LTHSYRISIRWTGNSGTGTSAYRAYERSHIISSAGKESLEASSDAMFRGDKSKYNPEDLFIAALSSCHMLSYLHVCVTEGVIVTAYSDDAEGILEVDSNGSGRIISVTLFPHVTVAEESMRKKADELHHKASKLCFIANSCSCPVYHRPVSEALTSG
jgi:organic hydroperoxide reductase OsmC/OhrA